jgi:hypothetical protein
VTRALAATLRQDDVATIRLELVQDFVGAHPALRDGLVEAEPWLASALDTLAVELPLPQSVGSFVSPPFYRPPGSERCFYYCPGLLHPDGPGRDTGRAVLALKGLEPGAADLDKMLAHLQLRSLPPHTMAEHLILEEQKIPACVGLPEALGEATRAAEVQIAHRQAYGTFARLPLPLLVFRHPDAVAQRWLEQLRTIVSARSFERVEPWARAGLGVYVYYYPTPPSRARDVDSVLQGREFRRRTFALMGLCDPEVTVRRWAVGFIRLLYLGYLPGTAASQRSGICCQPQNACVDGGFVDLDSVTPFDALPDDAALDAGLQLSYDSLLESVAALLVGGHQARRPEGRDVRADWHHLNRYLWGLMAEAIESEGRAHLALDNRVAGYFAGTVTFGDLVERLNRSYSQPHDEVVAAAAGYTNFGLSLMAAARD